MTSKFFVEGNVSDQQNSNGDDQNQSKKVEPNYQYDFMDDDNKFSSKKRVVLTEKDKKWTAMRELTNKVNVALNNKDYQKIWNLLQDLLKDVKKSEKIIETQGYPVFFLKLVHRINEEVNAVSAEDKKKMKKHSATAYNIMKQKMKNKIYPEFEGKIKEMLEKGQEEEFSSEEEVVEDDDESEEEEEDFKKLLESKDPMERRKYWLKRTDKKKEDQEKQKDKDLENQVDKNQEKEKEKDKIKEEENKNKKKPKLTNQPKKKQEIASVKDAELRMKAIIKDFAKLHTREQREEYLQNLNQIAEKSKSYKDFQKLSFLLVDIPIRIDVSRQMKLTHFTRKQYLIMFNSILQIYQILSESEEENLIDNVILFNETSSNQETVAASEENIFIALKTYVILLEVELKKSFMFIDNSELEFSQRLQDLIKLTNLMYKLSRDLSVRDGQEKEAAEIAYKVLENTYFMSADFLKKIQEDSNQVLQFVELSLEKTLESYANSILKELRNQEDKITKTILYLAYNHSLNSREKGKQLLIMSNIPEQINTKDYYTQALYNRVMVQIGLNAFRNGNMIEVQQFLSELCSYGKTRDQNREVIRQFLAQGYSRSLNQKQIPRNKILPYYLHLNVDVIQCLELIASMINEIPYTLMEGGRITSKTFKKVYFEYERSHFIAEPLNSRDLIYAASNQLKNGNWKECYDRLMELNILNQVTHLELTKVNLLKVIKEQSLKCYIIGNRKCYRSISLLNLATKFSLEEKQIRRLVCKMIQQRQIQGSITQSGYLNFIQKKQTEMQKICEHLFMKLNDIIQANEQQFTQRVNATNVEDNEEEQDKEEPKFTRRVNIAMNQKLKFILNRRSQKA